MALAQEFSFVHAVTGFDAKSRYLFRLIVHLSEQIISMLWVGEWKSVCAQTLFVGVEYAPGKPGGGVAIQTDVVSCNTVVQEIDVIAIVDGADQQWGAHRHTGVVPTGVGAVIVVFVSSAYLVG